MSPLLTFALTAVRSKYNLTDRQNAVLGCLVEMPDQEHTVRGLASTLGVARPVITRSADKLVDLGLISRVHDERDRRSVLLSARSAGRKYWNDAMKAMEKAR